MTNDQIENFLQKKGSGELQARISFKTRQPITGLFIQSNDYAYLKTKNLWRIVGENSMKDYLKTKDESLARIFNGVEFTKLS
jgi:hypothetical protein